MEPWIENTPCRWTDVLPYDSLNANRHGGSVAYIGYNTVCKFTLAS